jgi:formylglycine-generating enzyme required for sulfatase activity
MSKVRDVMEQSGALVRVLIFDACRGSAVNTKGGEADPRPIEGRPEGTLIAFASAHKQDALFDARQRNSLYTGRLLSALKSPDADFKGLLEGVQRQVYEDTRHQQTPYLYGFLSGPLYLASLSAPPLATAKLDAAAEAWALLRDSKTPEDFEDFAGSFPNSDLATAARLRAGQLRRASAAGSQRQGPAADSGSGPAAPPAGPTDAPPTQDDLFRRFFGGGSGAARQTKVNPKDGLTYVWIEPGTFMMGCAPGDDDCLDREKPPHKATIAKGFWMGQTPVTQEAYKTVTGKTPSRNKGLKLPVEQVDWNEARSYCQATGMRLPTQTEWEYAARAGSTGIRYGDLDRIAWWRGNSASSTHEVGLKEPNAWGLYDMLGNVWQWTATEESNGQFRWLRGGSFINDTKDVRLSKSYLFGPDYKDYNFGFRCAGD